MKNTNKFAAYHFSQKRVTAVELVHSDNDFELTSLVERENDGSLSNLLSSPLRSDSNHVDRLVKEISSIQEEGDITAPNISFCLDSQWVITHTFPTEENLSEAESADHLRWELSHYLESGDYDDFITATARLDSLPHPGVSLVLSASVRRDLISLLCQVTSKLGLSLAVIDVDHFGAEHALRWNYPEIEQETVVLLALKSEHLHLTLFRKGIPVRYRTAEILNAKTMLSILDEFFIQNGEENSARKKVYLYGEKMETMLRKELPGLSINSETGNPTVELLDPMKRLKLSRRLCKMDRLSFHRFAPAVGIAMRKG